MIPCAPAPETSIIELSGQDTNSPVNPSPNRQAINHGCNVAPSPPYPLDREPEVRCQATSKNTPRLELEHHFFRERPLSADQLFLGRPAPGFRGFEPGKVGASRTSGLVSNGKAKSPQRAQTQNPESALNPFDPAVICIAV